MSGIVTLLTDFGTTDSYVAEVKAVLLARAPGVTLVDVSHRVPPGGIGTAQYLLARAWRRFPAGTVHLAVVDPGVGTARRALAAEAQGHRFVAPDNGLLSFLPTDARYVELPVPPSASPTFHGRDVFAPAAARLVAGETLDRLGAPVVDVTRVALPAPAHDGTRWVGRVVHVDHFGTLITNLPGDVVEPGVRIQVGERDIGPLRRTFGAVERGQLLAFVGSNGTVEIAVRDGHAARLLGVGEGTEVKA